MHDSTSAPDAAAAAPTAIAVHGSGGGCTAPASRDLALVVIPSGSVSCSNLRPARRGATVDVLSATSFPLSSPAEPRDETGARVERRRTRDGYLENALIILSTAGEIFTITEEAGEERGGRGP